MWSSRATKLVAVFVLIIVGYVGYGIVFGGWLSNEPIQITYYLEDPPIGRRWRGNDPPVKTVHFGMDRKLVPTLIKVEPIIPPEADIPPTDGSVFVLPDRSPVWWLQTDPESDPPKRTSKFAYGERISGMQSMLESRRPRPLKPGQAYLLTVEAGSRRGQIEFQTEPASNRAASRRP